MAKRRWRLWFTVPIKGTQWKVGFGELRGTDQAECDYDKAKITIGWHVARELVHSLMWHELGHANADMTGADNVLKKNIPSIDSGQIVEYEEGYMRVLNQGMFAMALDACWLRLPEIPAWFDAK